MQLKTFLFLLLSVGLLGLAFYFLSNLIIYILVAFIFSIIGRPIVKFLHERFKLPLTISSILSLLAMLSVLFFIFYFTGPLLASQVQNIGKIDYTSLSANVSTKLSDVNNILGDKGVEVDQERIESYLYMQGENILSKLNVNSLFSSIFGFLSDSFIALFSILFICFFFLKDQKLFRSIIFLFIPESYRQKAENILNSTQKLLTRYFIGLVCEVLSMMIMLSLGLYLLGVENALLFGCIGGLLNVIPYLGPVLGASIASLLLTITTLGSGIGADLLWTIVKVIAVFGGANLIDNFLLQPIIYSNSVKAHPLEIFFVILIFGTLFGVVGMIIAIPIYTLLRIVAKELFSSTEFVRKLTKNL